FLLCYRATADAVIYTLSLHDALPICQRPPPVVPEPVLAFPGHRLDLRVHICLSSGSALMSHDTIAAADHGHDGAAHGTLKSYLVDRKITRLNSSHVKISYAVFCLKKK